VISSSPRAEGLSPAAISSTRIREALARGAAQVLGRPLATTPEVPADRLAALRAAFRATMADPEFRAEAASANFEVNPVLGEDMQRIVVEVLATPKEVAARVKHLVE